MKINYVENKNGKLFSFHRHDFKENTDSSDNYIFIDGGFEYIRYSGDLKQGEIKDLMPEIREKLVWGQNHNEKNERLSETIYKPLKDLTTSHISGIIRHLLEHGFAINSENGLYYSGKARIAILLIFTYELENRLKDEMERQNIKTKRAR